MASNDSILAIDNALKTVDINTEQKRYEFLIKLLGLILFLLKKMEIQITEILKSRGYKIVQNWH
jgi:hypothetical protein